VEGVDKKHPAILVQRARYPDRQRNADGQVAQITNDDVHSFLIFRFINLVKSSW
jgi:hypothetical protein